ncbi:VOC family protein [Microcoleus sp. FACHB-1515]|uniref:VOC family protein n=1 Tax=Cyanophyceae TaxID=3028117 RepID=UPI0016886855|nr:VOC family protein [Microcoleus sp. FACHB-1515]MBD2090650.1 VOC family protein [Microcoleus sp. FACHB-1515]
MESGFKGGIPTARNIDHAGYTVPDLDQAIDFFITVLGCELLYQAGPYGEPEPNWMQTHLGASPGEVRLALLRCGPVNNIELVEFKALEQTTTPPRVSDAGGRHLAFYVDDMDAAIAYLKAQRDVKVLESIVHAVDESEEAGITSTYFITPWGMHMELINRPDHAPYEQRTSARIFGSV